MAVIRPLVIGFATTLKHLFKKPITVNYPEQKFPMFPKCRGKQVLMRDENGLEKCVACGLCSVACPADAIYLEAAENDGTVQAGPRYASVYQIHKTRCIFCGYCEEACPVGAIFMGKDYELAVYSKDDFVWDKTDLLVPASTTAAPADGQVVTGARDEPGSPDGHIPNPESRPDCDADRRARRHPRRVRRPSSTIMTRHPDVPLWVCVGDVASNDGEYFTPVAPLYWIKGNNEDFDVIAAAIAGRPPAPTLHYLPNGGPHPVGPWRVAALGGTFAPSWYHTPAAGAAAVARGARPSAASLKLGKSRDDKRRHFVRDEVLACKALTEHRSCS